MSALTQDRNTPMALGDLREGAVAAAVKLFAGAIVMRNATGFLTPGATATGLVGVGRAEAQFDNSAGAAGDIQARYRPGVYRYANSAAADAITAAEIGKACYAVDDQTVAKTSATNTRSKAGVVEMVDAQGVWVRFDEALTRVTA
ncbi:MAG: hypothetical protein CVT82_00350 [Alphaproteobacteria bacterium HGW-Alphaproteobacteria-4]|nr:MAG: hypothetical protein CVT82_00350 [Alphaproteobacteria bacterium HGW-Alphaproteobacteria-4]